jgi:hypothetical protein
LADYVRKTMLSQGYAHIDPIELNQDQKEKYELDLKVYQEPRAKRFLYAEITPEVKTKDGSLRVYTTVYGSLSTALGEFKDFNEALNQLYASSKMLAEACVLESLFLTKATRRQLVHSEARTGVVKKTKDIFDLILELGREVGDSDNTRKLELKRINRQFKTIEEKVRSLFLELVETSDQELVADQILAALVLLPDEPRRLAKQDRQTLEGYREAHTIAVEFAKALYAVEE